MTYVYVGISTQINKNDFLEVTNEVKSLFVFDIILFQN